MNKMKQKILVELKIVFGDTNKKHYKGKKKSSFFPSLLFSLLYLRN